MAKYMPELVKGMKNYGKPLGNLPPQFISLYFFKKGSHSAPCLPLKSF